MAYKLFWLRRASNELDEIYQFYGELASVQVAKRRVGKIIEAVNHLQTMPYLGRKDEEFEHIRAYRYLIVLTYKVYYFIEGDTVFIASIWDCRQGGKAFYEWILDYDIIVGCPHCEVYDAAWVAQSALADSVDKSKTIIVDINNGELV